MSILDVVFKRRYTAAQFSEQLEAFDTATVTMEARRAEIRRQLPNLAAREALGELEKSEAKALQGFRDEQRTLDADLETRTATRAVIARALGAAEAEEARALRLAKLAEARAWQKRMGTASDELVAAMNAVTEKLETLRKVDAQMPSFINEAKSSVAPAIGGWLTTFRYYVEPDAFGHAIGALGGQRALLDQVLAEIEAGVPSRADRRAATGLPA